MILLGMTGPIGHGKTTLADALARLVPSTVHFESSLVIAEVADAMHACLTTIPDPYDVDALNNWLKSLPAILLELAHTHCTFEQIKIDPEDVELHPVEYQKLILHVENLQRQPKLARQNIDKDNKESYRPFLQWLGGYLVKKVNPGLWYDELVRRIKHEQQRGAELVIVGGLRFPSDATILRKAGGIVVKVYRPGHLQNDMLDPTERERENIKVDCTIMCDGGVEAVYKFAPTLLQDIKDGNIQHLYQTGHET